MARKRHDSASFFSTSFLDVLANTIGGLAFLLVLAVILVGDLVFVAPQIMTEQLPDGYYGAEYAVWLGAREGMGKFQWELGEGQKHIQCQPSHAVRGIERLGNTDERGALIV